jgi:hypothetical protein
VRNQAEDHQHRQRKEYLTPQVRDPECVYDGLEHPFILSSYVQSSRFKVQRRLTALNLELGTLD